MTNVRRKGMIYHGGEGDDVLRGVLAMTLRGGDENFTEEKADRQIVRRQKVMMLCTEAKATMSYAAVQAMTDDRRRRR